MRSDRITNDFTPIERFAVRKEKAAGFTLIELLVVIAIISLLVSILLPSLQRAKDLALRVQCMTQMKNIGMAVVLYGEDYDQRFYNMPRPWTWDPTALTKAFVRALAPYMNLSSEEIEAPGREGKEPFICPEDQTNDPYYTIYGRMSSYCPSPHLSQYPNTYSSGNVSTLYMSDSRHPDLTALLRCGIGTWHTNPTYNWLWLDTHVDTSESHGLWWWDGPGGFIPS
jgi:prepilin-type N-terminal cleavage/methylation domain-containing protein